MSSDKQNRQGGRGGQGAGRGGGGGRRQETESRRADKRAGGRLIGRQVGRFVRRPGQAGPLEQHEARQAMVMLLPTVFIVLAIIALPLLANLWISVKPVSLGDLRPPRVLTREVVQTAHADIPHFLVVRYRLRNSSKKVALTDIRLRDTAVPGFAAINTRADGSEDSGAPCRVEEETREILCTLARLEAGARVDFLITLAATWTPVNAQEDAADAAAAINKARASKPAVTSRSDYVLLNAELSWKNYAALFRADDFWEVLRVSLLYTFGGTGGALLLGLFAALLLARPCAGRAVWRGMLLFPYVAPVIAVAFTWVVLFDPFSGVVNALLLGSGATDAPINFFGVKNLPFEVFGFTLYFPLALASVIAFECWRYFPLAFLFILARMQSLNAELDDAAEMDGASPLQKFLHILLPQLVGILSVMFLLRFIWTFNKFDDIFLLTGGASGTRTLVVNVYEQAFALTNIGAGAAAAVMVLLVLLVCCALYFRFAPKEEGW